MHETSFSVNYNNEQALHKMKNKKIMKVNAQRKTIGPATYDQDQEKFHQHKEKQACLKEFMEKMDDLFEEVRMDIETEDKWTQDIGHTFMTLYGISDKEFSEEIDKNLLRLAATQYPNSRNILIHDIDKLTMESENDWKTFSRERKEELQQFQDSLVYNQVIKNNFPHAWKQIYEHMNAFCDTL